MVLGGIWRQLGLVIGLIICWTKAFPMDMDDMKDALQTGVILGAGAVSQLADNAKGKFNREISIGGFRMKTDIEAGAFNDAGDSSEEDSKRRRRSTSDNEAVLPPTSNERHRKKRSPCGQRRRMQSTTTAAPPAQGAGGENSNENDLPRRKRSPIENEIDENIDIIPVQRTFAERGKEFGEKMRQIMANMLEAMAGMFENLRKNFERPLEGQNDGM